MHHIDENGLDVETHAPPQSVAVKIAFASLVGTTIEFYDFLLYGTAVGCLMAFPFFWLIDSGRPELLTAALVLGTIGPAAMFGPQASFFAELFGTRVRYSGASLGYQVASVFAGGLSPFVATALLAASGGSPAPIAVYMVALGLVSIVSVWAAAETAGLPKSGRLAPPTTAPLLTEGRV